MLVFLSTFFVELNESLANSGRVSVSWNCVVIPQMFHFPLYTTLKKPFHELRGVNSAVFLFKCVYRKGKVRDCGSDITVLIQKT